MSNIEAVWVVGSFEGEQAKRVLAEADSGTGYLVVERGGNRSNPAVLAAFLRPSNDPVPPHLQEVKDPFKIAEYDKRRNQRQGIRT